MANASDFLNLKSYLPPEDNSSDDSDDGEDKVFQRNVYLLLQYLLVYLFVPQTIDASSAEQIQKIIHFQPSANGGEIFPSSAKKTSGVIWNQIYKRMN